MTDDHPTAPVDVTEERTWFDQAADTTSHIVARPQFFLVSLAIVVLWGVFGPPLDYSHGWVDAFGVVVAMITFLMVALLQNGGWRADKATQRKLNAIAAALAELMAKSDVDEEHVRQLSAAVGLEKRESSTR
ncbi:MAG TPA: low affinity iron permease family protein [Acidimicrobiales bacterium]|nr:low affinity iron permease family protein [Acidimicrobiales bacterium]